MNNNYSVIIGTGSYIPANVVKNEAFADHVFYDGKGRVIQKENSEILDKFEQITTIAERRHASDEYVTSDIAYLAAQAAIEDAGIDAESLDYIILAHNFGNIKAGQNRSDILPTLAARVKQKLGIVNPSTIAYDITFGCPGWVQAMIQANYYIKSGDVNRVLVIGADILSRVCDPHDRDSLLYADGAGAAILERKESDTPIGILGHASRSDTLNHAHLLFMDGSYNKEHDSSDLFLKMHGRRLYQYALENVPMAIRDCLIKTKVDLADISKILIHQANGKMDAAILERLYELYPDVEIPDNVMPMTVDYLGNSSVATVPTLLDLILHGQMSDHSIQPGNKIVLTSVGAGMNINAIVYGF